MRRILLLVPGHHQRAFLFFFLAQVQNMTQSIQVLDQRTQRDLQYVEKMEIQLRGLETKFRQVEESHKQNIAKQYKVHVVLSPMPVPFGTLTQTP